MRLRTRSKVPLRRVVNILLKHTYDYTPINTVPVLDINDDPVLDDYGDPTYTNGIQVTDNKCLFVHEDIIVSNERGGATVRVPTLYVEYDSAIAVGYLVQNVQSADGTVLLNSATVQSIDTTADMFDSVVKVLRLSGVITNGL